MSGLHVVVICQQYLSAKFSRRQAETVEIIAVLEGSHEQQVVFHQKTGAADNLSIAAAQRGTDR